MKPELARMVPSGPGIFRVGNNVSPPVLVSKTEPEYS